jgi:hypothetical protein
LRGGNGCEREDGEEKEFHARIGEEATRQVKRGSTCRLICTLDLTCRNA